MTITTPEATNRRPEHQPAPCHLPAVGSWAVYDYASGSPNWVGVVVHCRFHEQPARVTAQRMAERAGPKASLYPGALRSDFTGPSCEEERNPVQLGDVLDRERIIKAADAARAAIAELVHLTANAYGHSFEIGNEGAVIAALNELADDLEDQVGTVARRMAGRTSWQRVAEATGSMTRADRPGTARRAWAEWGGGPGDEEPPTD